MTLRDLLPGDVVINLENPENVDHCIVIGKKYAREGNHNREGCITLYLMSFGKRGEIGFHEDEARDTDPIPDGYEVIRNRR